MSGGIGKITKQGGDYSRAKSTSQYDIFKTRTYYCIYFYRYSWCSEYLIEDKFKWSPHPQMEDLIPLESKSSQKSMKQNMLKKRIIVGHNVGFDRSFIKEQYYIKVKEKKNHVPTIFFILFA